MIFIEIPALNKASLFGGTYRFATILYEIAMIPYEMVAITTIFELTFLREKQHDWKIKNSFVSS